MITVGVTLRREPAFPATRDDPHGILYVLPAGQAACCLADQNPSGDHGRPSWFPELPSGAWPSAKLFTNASRSLTRKRAKRST